MVTVDNNIWYEIGTIDKYLFLTVYNFLINTILYMSVVFYKW